MSPYLPWKKKQKIKERNGRSCSIRVFDSIFFFFFFFVTATFLLLFLSSSLSLISRRSAPGIVIFITFDVWFCPFSFHFCWMNGNCKKKKKNSKSKEFKTSFLFSLQFFLPLQTRSFHDFECQEMQWIYLPFIIILIPFSFGLNSNFFLFIFFSFILSSLSFFLFFNVLSVFFEWLSVEFIAQCSCSLGGDFSGLLWKKKNKWMNNWIENWGSCFPPRPSKRECVSFLEETQNPCWMSWRCGFCNFVLNSIWF